MKCIFLGFAAVLFSAAAAAAAPFDCTREVVGSTDISLRYSANRFDRIANFDVSSFGDFSEGCSIGGTGRINTVSKSGLARLSNGEDYVVALRGDLGTSLFDEDFSGFPDLDDQSTRPPDHRLDFWPLGGRNLDFTYPNGFSITLNCPSPEADRPGIGNCGGDGFGEFFLLRVEDERSIDIFSDGGGPYVLGAVPLPAGLPLAMGALGLLGWVSHKRRR